MTPGQALRFLRCHSPQVRLRQMAVCVAILWLAGCAGPTGREAPAGRARLSADQAQAAAIHALGLVGTPYRYGGNTVEGGFDCSGLIGFVLQSASQVRVPRTVAQLAEVGVAVPPSQLRSGDLVLFGRGRPSHAGIYVGEGRFVHAPSTGGEVRQDRLDGPYWSRQTWSARRP